MFEIGFLELALLGVIALLVVGPSRLPGLVRTVGMWVGRAQRLVAQVRADIEREVRADELRKAAKEYSPTAVISDVRKEMEDFASDVSKPLDRDAGKPGSEKPESAKSGSEESAGNDGAPPAAADTEFRTESEPPGAVAEVAPEAETGGSESAEPPAPGGPDPRFATAAPRTAAGTANGAEAPADGPPAAQPAGPGESPAVERAAATPASEPPAGTEPAPASAGAACPNGRADDAAAPALTESAEAPPAERDERTAAP